MLVLMINCCDEFPRSLNVDTNLVSLGFGVPRFF